jgi:hypothetical protein
MSVEIRHRTVGMIVGGGSITEAAEAFGRPVRTVRHLYKKYLQTTKGFFWVRYSER